MQSAWQLEIFFDGDCPICRREIAMIRRLDRRGRVRFTDIAASDFDPRPLGTTWEALMERMHVRLRDGRWVEGVEAFRQVYTAVGWGPVVALTRVPGVSHFLEWGYRVFARNRLRWTGRCAADGACRVTPAGSGQAATAELSNLLSTTATSTGPSLEVLSHRAPTLVVFLRHAGCTFCREALADLRLRRRFIEGQGTQLVLVHQGSEAEAAEFFARYGVADLPRVSDPQRRLYQAFGLARGNLRQLLGLRVWWRGLRAALAAGHGFGPAAGDVRQMPGIFLLVNGRVVRSYRHTTAADRPDYVALARCDECVAAG